MFIRSTCLDASQYIWHRSEARADDPGLIVRRYIFRHGRTMCDASVATRSTAAERKRARMDQAAQTPARAATGHRTAPRNRPARYTHREAQADEARDTSIPERLPASEAPPERPSSQAATPDDDGIVPIQRQHPAARAPSRRGDRREPVIHTNDAVVPSEQLLALAHHGSALLVYPDGEVLRAEF